MKRSLGIGVALGAFLLMPATIPDVVHISYAVPIPPPVVEVVTPLLITPVGPVTLGVGDRMVEDIEVSVPTAEREVEYLSKHEIKTILAQTSWRSHVTGHVIQIEDGSWIQDNSMFEQIYHIIMCESTGRPDAIGDSGDSYGLFQINMNYWSQLVGTRNVLDPVENAQIAYEIWMLQGWNAWSCYGR